MTTPFSRSLLDSSIQACLNQAADDSQKIIRSGLQDETDFPVVYTSAVCPYGISEQHYQNQIQGNMKALHALTRLEGRLVLEVSHAVDRDNVQDNFNVSIRVKSKSYKEVAELFKQLDQMAELMGVAPSDVVPRLLDALKEGEPLGRSWLDAFFKNALKKVQEVKTWAEDAEKSVLEKLAKQDTSIPALSPDFTPAKTNAPAQAEVTQAAKRLYQESCVSDTVHCNRFPAWEELTTEQTRFWIDKAQLSTLITLPTNES